jgi:hypothetical protein
MVVSSELGGWMVKRAVAVPQSEPAVAEAWYSAVTQTAPGLLGSGAAAE